MLDSPNDMSSSSSSSRVPHFRKRKAENGSDASLGGFLSLDDPPADEARVGNVVDGSKVIQYLNKMNIKDGENPSLCIKIVVCDLEAELITQELQEKIQKEFHLSSISISEKKPHTVERIITLHGELAETLRATLYVSFLLVSDFNNLLKTENFTLKSANYRVNVLVEVSKINVIELAKKFPKGSMNADIFEKNINLHIMELSGMFTSMFNSLTYIFDRYGYSEYIDDSKIELQEYIASHDGDYLRERSDDFSEEIVKNREELLKYIFTSTFLNRK